jgi:hypothetical protein
MTTQYDKALENYTTGRITVYKEIKRFCPSDLLENGVDDCEGEKEDSKCEKCWMKEIGETK